MLGRGTNEVSGVQESTLGTNHRLASSIVYSPYNLIGEVAVETLARLVSITLAIVLVGCDQGGAADEGELPKAKDVVIGITVSTSFVDRGVKAIIFEDGQGYAYQQVEGEYEFANFKLPAEDKTELVKVFVDHNFLKLPATMKYNVTDGTARWILFADSQSSHDVYNYMVKSRDFDGVQEEFETKIIAYLRMAKEIRGIELLEAVSMRAEKMAKDSSKRKATSTWLDYVARNIVANGLVEREAGEEFYVPGDGALLFRKRRG